MWKSIASPRVVRQLCSLNQQAVPASHALKACSLQATVQLQAPSRSFRVMSALRQENHDEDWLGSLKSRSLQKKPRVSRESRQDERYSSSQEMDEEDPFTSFREGYDGVGAHLKKRDFRDVELAPSNFAFYTPSEAVEARPQAEVDAFLADNDISIVRGDPVPKPILSFDEVEFPDAVRRTITNMGFERPMPIQSQGWPIALSGLDLVGIGQTGSGKTLGFLLPAILHILNQPTPTRRNAPRALVMAPTRELAQQIADVMRQYSHGTGVRYATVYGGSQKMQQLRDLGNSPGIVFATPGRLLDLLSSDDITLEDCSYLVLDEADRMLDMGFEPQIRKIIEQVRPDRQLLMWSATWPKDVQELAHDFFEGKDREYVHLSIGSTELAANKNITQIVEVCEPGEETDRVIEFVQEANRRGPKDRVLIFAETKRNVDWLERTLSRRGVRANAIHGDKSQRVRETVLRDFRTARVPILIATNVAARGIDVDDVKYVVNHTFPPFAEDYVHRIGRTGRSNKKGLAYTCFTEESASQAKELIKILEEAGQEVPDDLRELSAAARARKKSMRKDNPYKKKYQQGRKGTPRYGVGW